MAHGFLQYKRLKASECKYVGVVNPTIPIKRGRPILFGNEVQSVRKPKFRSRITPVEHEFEILTVSHEARGKLVRLKKRPVPGQLVIKGESVTGMPDCTKTPLKRKPFKWWRVTGWLARHIVIRGQLRIRTKQVLDVSDNELLMLLLMLKTEFQHRCHVPELTVSRFH